MEEKLILFETAKLAKEKGFNEIVICGYGQCGDDELYSLNDVNRYPAPAQSFLQQWLIETHNIVPFVKPYLAADNKIKYLGCILIIDKHVSGGYYEWATHISYETFEEALEPALVEALNRIQNK